MVVPVRSFTLHTESTWLKPILDIVHAVSYSLLLLNTDLHVAELTSRMSRNQFVRNTLTAIQMQFQPTPPGQLSTSDLTYDDCSSSIRGSEGPETITRSHRSNSIISRTSVSRDDVVAPPNPPDTIHVARDPDGSTPSVQVSTTYRPSLNPVYGRAWESDMEILLKVVLRFDCDPCSDLTFIRKCTMRSRANKFCSHSTAVLHGRLYHR